VALQLDAALKLLGVLVRLSCVGEDAALVEFCREEWPRLVGSLSLYLGRRDLAEDIAQETLVRVCGRWRQVREAVSPSAWAHRVAFNLAKSHGRRDAVWLRVRSRALPRDLELQEHDDAEAASVRAADGTDLDARFRTLVQSPLRAGILRYLSARPDESFDVESLMQTFGRLKLDVENCVRELVDFGVVHAVPGTPPPPPPLFPLPGPGKVILCGEKNNICHRAINASVIGPPSS
jgi:DNA-directed RNA polymerase specialized sigma24 family protein